MRDGLNAYPSQASDATPVRPAVAARPAIALPALLVFAAAFWVYALTANRGAQWQDSGFHILRIVTGQLDHPLGLALVHPLHHWLGRAVVAIGGLEPAFAVSLVSAAAAALAVMNVFGCVATLTGTRAAALLAAASLAVAHTFWQMATRAETYTLTAALLAGECWCIAAFATSGSRSALRTAFLLNGLGIANHMLASLSTPVLVAAAMVAWRRKRIPTADLASAAGMWLFGSAPYTGLIVGRCVATGDIANVLHSALFGNTFAPDVLNTSLTGAMLVIAAGFIALNFPNLLVPAAAFGMGPGGKRLAPPFARRFLIAQLIVYAVFSLRYRVVDQYTFFIPMYVVLCVLGGIGFAALAARTGGDGPPSHGGRWFTIAVVALVLTPVFYGVAPVAARRLELLATRERHKPYRDDYTYVFAPWSRADDSAERISREAAELAGEDGTIVIEDPMAEFAVRYRLIRDGRTDVTVVPIPRNGGAPPIVSHGQAVVLVPKRVGHPIVAAPRGTWEKRGELYVLADAAPGG